MKKYEVIMKNNKYARTRTNKNLMKAFPRHILLLLHAVNMFRLTDAE